MAKTIVAIIIVALLVGGGWFLYTDKPVESNATSETQDSNNTASTSSDNGLITREPSTPGRKVYINQVWRFSFEYPVGWKIREPAFGSATTLFNLAVWPEEENTFDPVSVNFTPKWWIDRLLDRKEGEVQIGGLDGWYYQSVTMSVIPKMSYFVLVNNEYWVNIGIQNEYLEELKIVLDTFEFHDPPTLEELGIDPPMPGD